MKTLRPIASDVFRELEPKNCWFFAVFAVKTWFNHFYFTTIRSARFFYPKKVFFQINLKTFEIGQKSQNELLVIPANEGTVQIFEKQNEK